MSLVTIIDAYSGYWYNTFSVNATIAAPFLYLLGGYVNVTNTNLLAIIADVSHDDVHRSAAHCLGKLSSS
jgi:hypothetical protein